MENIRGEELGSFETGSRPSINQETESYFDETLDQAIEGLRSKECYRIPDVINRLDNNKKATKEKLAQALNMGGFDWRIFDTLVTDAASEKTVSGMIVSWAEEVELAADNDAIRVADKTLADQLENF